MSPTETWAAHSRPRAQDALQAARGSGWWLKKSGAQAKAWGVITCGNPDLPREQRCSIIVLSTSGSQDGSQTAQAINGAVRKCTHTRAATGDVGRLEQAGLLLSQASRCLNAASALIEAAEHRELVEDYLNASLDAADEAERLLDAAMAAELDADEAEATARGEAEFAGVPVGSGPEGLAKEALSRATTAAGLLADASDREARLLRGKCEDIRATARTMLM